MFASVCAERRSGRGILCFGCVTSLSWSQRSEGWRLQGSIPSAASICSSGFGPNKMVGRRRTTSELWSFTFFSLVPLTLLLQSTKLRQLLQRSLGQKAGHARPSCGEGQGTSDDESDPGEVGPQWEKGSDCRCCSELGHVGVSSEGSRGHRRFSYMEANVIVVRGLVADRIDKETLWAAMLRGAYHITDAFKERHPAVFQVLEKSMGSKAHAGT